MKDATRTSENFHIEKVRGFKLKCSLIKNIDEYIEDKFTECLQQMLEDKLRETDWEVTQESIEEQVARESYLQWLKDNEKRAKKHAPVSAENILFICTERWYLKTISFNIVLKMIGPQMAVA